MTRITTPGFYAMPAAQYHADCCDKPSLSASVANVLLAQSPAHARHIHPRLNPALLPSVPTPEMDEGSALHALILERQSIVAVCDFEDWRSKDAKSARQLARGTGKVPILRRRWDVLQSVAGAVRDALAAHEVGDVFAAPGFAEQVMCWREETPSGPIWCRSRVDWLPGQTKPLDGGAHIYDLKTVGGSAEPGAWGRKLSSDGYGLQAAFYLRGARALGTKPSGFRFVVVERDPPHGLSVVECAPDLMHFAEMQAQAAINLFAHHLYSGEWPAYPPLVASVEALPWMTAQWEERSLRAESIAKRKPVYMPESAAVVKSGVPFA